MDKPISLKFVYRQIVLFHENENDSVFGSVGRLKWLGPSEIYWISFAPVFSCMYF